MDTYHLGEVLLVAFPFSDQHGAKRRPALVLLDAGDADVLVARITSQPVGSEHDVPLAEWRQAGLALPSIVRLHKLATLEKRLVQRRLGALSAGDLALVQRGLSRVWGLPSNRLEERGEE